MQKDRELYGQEMVSVRSQFLNGRHPIVLCNSGWYWLIVACHKTLLSIDKNYRIKHIKTSNGFLDIAVIPSRKEFQLGCDEVTSRFEALSAFVCEICADRGAIRVTTNGGYFTSCETHAFGFGPVIHPLDVMNVDTLNNPSFKNAADDKLNELMNVIQDLRSLYEQERNVCDQIAAVLIHTLGESNRHWPREDTFIPDVRAQYDAAQDAYLAIRSGMQPLLPFQN